MIPLDATSKLYRSTFAG